jgi:hypothetical protein
MQSKAPQGFYTEKPTHPLYQRKHPQSYGSFASAAATSPNASQNRELTPYGGKQKKTKTH